MKVLGPGIEDSTLLVNQLFPTVWQRDEECRVWTWKELDSSPASSPKVCELLVVGPSLTCFQSVSAFEMKRKRRVVDNIHCSEILSRLNAVYVERGHRNCGFTVFSTWELPSLLQPHSLAIRTRSVEWHVKCRKITVPKNQRTPYLQEP